MYKITRLYENWQTDENIETGLTLEEAKAYCKDPETSSRTCTTTEGIRRTEVFGNWFCSYEEE